MRWRRERDKTLHRICTFTSKGHTVNPEHDGAAKAVSRVEAAIVQHAAQMLGLEATMRIDALDASMGRCLDRALAPWSMSSDLVWM